MESADLRYLLAPLQPLPSQPKTENHVFGMVAERMPVFEGGPEGLIVFIRQNNQWPDGIDQVKGRVFVTVTINEQGHVVKPTITKGLHPALDAEALRLVQLLDGGWQPGEQNGKPVSVQFTLPITFDSTPSPATTRRKAKR